MGKSNKEVYIPLHEAARVYGYTRDHLGYLIRKGELKGQKLGSFYYTSHQWMKDYLVNSGKAREKNVRIRQGKQRLRGTKRRTILEAKPLFFRGLASVRGQFKKELLPLWQDLIKASKKTREAAKIFSKDFNNVLDSIYSLGKDIKKEVEGWQTEARYLITRLKKKIARSRIIENSIGLIREGTVLFVLLPRQFASQLRESLSLALSSFKKALFSFRKSFKKIQREILWKASLKEAKPLFFRGLSSIRFSPKLAASFLILIGMTLISFSLYAMSPQLSYALRMSRIELTNILDTASKPVYLSLTSYRPTQINNSRLTQTGIKLARITEGLNYNNFKERLAERGDERRQRVEEEWNRLVKDNLREFALKAKIRIALSKSNFDRLAFRAQRTTSHWLEPFSNLSFSRLTIEPFNNLTSRHLISFETWTGEKLIEIRRNAVETYRQIARNAIKMQERMYAWQSSNSYGLARIDNRLARIKEHRLARIGEGGSKQLAALRGGVNGLLKRFITFKDAVSDRWLAYYKINNLEQEIAVLKKRPPTKIIVQGKGAVGTMKVVKKEIVRKEVIQPDQLRILEDELIKTKNALNIRYSSLSSEISLLNSNLSNFIVGTESQWDKLNSRVDFAIMPHYPTPVSRDHPTPVSASIFSLASVEEALEGELINPSSFKGGGLTFSSNAVSDITGLTGSSGQNLDVTATSTRIGAPASGNYFKITNDGDLALYGIADTLDLSNVSSTQLVIQGGNTKTENILPRTDSTYDLGSSALAWRNLYVDNLVAAASDVSGTKQTTFTINSDYTGADSEDSQLVFERGSTTPNAIIKWDSTNQRFDFNQPVYLQNTLSAATTTLSKKLTISSGGASITGTTTIDNLRFSGNTIDTTSGNLTIQPASVSNDITIQQFNNLAILNGSVGIGTTSPSALLTVGATAGSQFLVNATGTVTDGIWQGTAIATQYGGTGQNWSTETAGKIPYFSATGTLSTLAAGTNNYLLYSNNGTPAWTNAPTVLGTNITSLNADNISSGTLAAARGGTGADTSAWTGLLRVTSGNWATSTIDISSDTNLAVSGTLLALTGDTLSVNEGTLTDTNLCAYVSGTGIVCNTAIGTDVQAYDAGLNSITGLTTGADQMLYLTGSDTYSTTTITSFGRSLVDDADASTARTTLGLGTMALLPNTGSTSITTLGTIGTGTWEGTAIGAAYGGTGLSSYTAGDILYASATTTLAKLNIGTSGQVLTTDGSTPSWGTITGSGITADSLNWSEFSDSMTLDATTTIAMSNPLNFDSGTLYIDAANNRVGIGTTSPASKLSVYGGVSIGANYVGTAAPPNGTIIQGNVGIGTASPSAQLHVNSLPDQVALAVSGYSLSSSNALPMLNLSGTWNTTGAPTAIKLNITNTASAASSGLLDLQVGGTSKFFVRADGNVGIGTTSPGAKLDVQGSPSGAGNALVDLTLTAATNAQALQITQANAGGDQSAASALFKITNSGANPYFNFDDKFIMLKSGNVGIGTASPGELLTIEGGTIKVVSNADKFSLFEDDVAEADAYFKLKNSTSDVGKFVPLLHMKSNATSSFYASGIVADTNSDAVGEGPVFSFMARSSNAAVANRDLFWFDNYYNDPKMVIKANGNVGIGTTAPDTKLHIADGGWFKIGPDGSTDADSIQLEPQGTFFRIASEELRFYDWSYGSDMVTFKDGNVGIGTTSPSQKLEVVDGNIQVTKSSGSALVRTLAGTVDLRQYADAGGTGYEGTISNHPFALLTNNTPRLYITADGNVGIGTTGPVSKLEIEGGKTTIDSTDSSYGQFQIGNSASGGEVSMAWISGVTGYGSPPTSVNGDSYIWVTGANIWGIGGNKWGIGNKGLSGNLAVTVQSNGNVGIGTTSPTYPLHVFRTGDGIVAGFRDDTGTCTINPNTTSLSCSSDVRMKTEIETIEGALDKILGIRGVNFKWINQNDDKNHIGVIAQEAEGILPELVSEDAEGYKTVGYAMFTPVLIEAIKEQQKQIEDLKLALNELGLVEGESMEHGTLTPEQSSAQGTAHSIEQGGETGILESIKTALATLSGQVKAAGEWIFDKITTRHLAIDTSEKENEDPTIGEGKISEMEQEVKIYNRNLKKSSKIFVSFNSNLGGRSWYVAEKHAIPGDDPANNYFIIRLSSAINHDVDFDYWIVQVAKGDQHETDTELLDTEQTQNTEHGTTATTSSSSTLGVFPPNGSSTPSVSPNEDTTATSTEVTNATTTEPIISSAEATTTQATTTQETTHDMEHETEDMKQKTWNMEQEAEETEEDLIDKAIDVLKKGEKEQEMIDNLKKELGETSEEESVEEPVETIEILEEIDFSNVTSSTL